jgi:hypothetical protein
MTTTPRTLYLFASAAPPALDIAKVINDAQSHNFDYAWASPPPPPAGSNPNSANWHD